MPRETLTSRPPPGRPPAGAPVAGPSARTGSTAPPWAPTPGTRNARPGGDDPDRGQLLGRRRADDEPDRAARAPARRRAGRRARGAAPRGAPSGRVGRDDQVLQLAGARDWRCGTAGRRSGRAAPGAASTASAPRYGLTVTASAPSPSNSATAWRAAVVPMSPRLASATTGTSAGRLARSRSRAAIPAEP